MKIEDTVSYALSRTTTAFRNALERSMVSAGLHGGQAFVLMELWKQDGLRQVDMAARLGVSTPTINKTLKGMIESGLVTCARLPGDARSTRIFLTPSGAEIRERIEAHWHELEELVVEGLTDAERLILFELLTKMRLSGEENEDDI